VQPLWPVDTLGAAALNVLQSFALCTVPITGAPKVPSIRITGTTSFCGEGSRPFTAKYTFGSIHIARGDFMDLSRQKVVVCGGGGFIGGHLIKQLLRDGVNVIRSVDVKPRSEWYQVH
jgi:hypothetical protein